MESNVFFYSERGLINSLVLDLKNNLEMTKVFFRTIKFGIDEDTADWIDNVQNVDWYIEFSASEFGNPDLIADVCCSNGHHVIFFEAKLHSYEKAAVSMDMGQPFAPHKDDGIYKSKSSSINAQLALRYRLAQTLKRMQWREIHSQDEPRIEESYEDAVYYHDMFKAIRDSQTGRRIHNSLMISVLDKIMQNDPDFYFVAMTFENNHHTFKSIQTNNPNLLPPLGLSKWEKVNKQFGLLNINDLIKTIQLNTDSYLSVSRDYVYFNPKSEADMTELNDETDEIEQQEIDNEEITSKDRFIRAGFRNTNIYGIWFDKIKEIAGNCFKDYKNSCSIVRNGKSILKLVYENNSVYLGFRDKLLDNLNNAQTTIISIQGVQFVSIELSKQSDEAIESAILSILFN